jgi:hypothetical protein
VTLDHSSDFDARRAGRRARRAAVGRIRRATALTAADRELRVQQARAAQTRGELSALTRGLDAAQPAVGPPLPGAVATSPSSWQQPPPAPQQPAGRRSSLSGKILIGVVAVVLVCGGSVVSCVSSLVDTVSDTASGGVVDRPSRPRHP